MNQFQTDESEEKVVIEIGKSRALVLDALLDRWDGEDMPATIRLEHPAEWAALWAIEAGLETQLVELFSPDYLERVELARQITSVNVGDWVHDRLTADERRGAFVRLTRKFTRKRHRA